MQRTGFWRRLAPVAGIDPRALGALRIGLGAVLLIDLWMRTGRFKALYTDAGVFPRIYLEPWMWHTLVPLHLLSGSLAWEVFLFAVAAVFAVALLLGYHARIAAVVSWALLVSLHSRDPMVLNFGDDILRMALFWGMFLPLGACWSLDARRTGRVVSRERVCSLATLAYLLQIAFVYFFTALLKSGPDWRSNGTALYYALGVDPFVTPVGTYVRQFPWLIWLVTRATLGLEALGPFLLFAPVGWLRGLTVAAFLSLHLGIAASYQLGIFPWTDLVVLLPFLPPGFWDRVERPLTGVRSVVSDAAASADPPPSVPGLRVARDVLIAVVLAYITAYNVDSVAKFGMPEWLTAVGNFVRVNQQWRMFTPDAPHTGGWFVIPGKLADGRTVDLSVRGPDLDWRRPARLWAMSGPFRWTIYMAQMKDPHTNHLLRRRWAEWRCLQWNFSHPASERLVSLEMYYMKEESLPPGQGSRTDREFLIAYNCAEGVVRWPADAVMPGQAPPPRPQGARGAAAP
jgi:hypothetical protein